MSHQVKITFSTVYRMPLMADPLIRPSSDQPRQRTLRILLPVSRMQKDVHHSHRCCTIAGHSRLGITSRLYHRPTNIHRGELERKPYFPLGRKLSWLSRRWVILLLRPRSRPIIVDPSARLDAAIVPRSIDTWYSSIQQLEDHQRIFYTRGSKRVFDFLRRLRP